MHAPKRPLNALCVSLALSVAASACGSNAENPGASASPADCESIIAHDRAGQEVGGLAAVFEHATGRGTASDEAAKVSLDAMYNVVRASDDVYVTSIEVGDATPVNLYVRQSGGPFHVFGSFHDRVGEDITATVSRTGDDRFLVVALSDRFFQPVWACLAGESGEEVCGTISADAGEALAWYIVDRQEMRLVASAHDRRGDGEGPGRTFEVPDIALCTKERFIQRATDR